MDEFSDPTPIATAEHSFPASLPDCTQVKRDRNEAIGVILLVALLLSGCSVLDNSERYYKNRPYQPINYRTYLTD